MLTSYNGPRSLPKTNKAGLLPVEDSSVSPEMQGICVLIVTPLAFRAGKGPDLLCEISLLPK